MQSSGRAACSRQRLASGQTDLGGEDSTDARICTGHQNVFRTASLRSEFRCAERAAEAVQEEQPRNAQHEYQRAAEYAGAHAPDAAAATAEYGHALAGDGAGFDRTRCVGRPGAQGQLVREDIPRRARQKKAGREHGNGRPRISADVALPHVNAAGRRSSCDAERSRSAGSRARLSVAADRRNAEFHAAAGHCRACGLCTAGPTAASRTFAAGPVACRARTDDPITCGARSFGSPASADGSSGASAWDFSTDDRRIGNGRRFGIPRSGRQ